MKAGPKRKKGKLVFKTEIPWKVNLNLSQIKGTLITRGI